MKLEEEITKAVKALGYSGTVKMAMYSYRRIIVWVDDVNVGIYDLDKHTFVD